VRARMRLRVWVRARLSVVYIIERHRHVARSDASTLPACVAWYAGSMVQVVGARRRAMGCDGVRRDAFGTRRLGRRTSGWAGSEGTQDVRLGGVGGHARACARRAERRTRAVSASSRRAKPSRYVSSAAPCSPVQATQCHAVHAVRGHWALGTGHWALGTGHRALVAMGALGRVW
jgi:hypothetical protein